MLVLWALLAVTSVTLLAGARATSLDDIAKRAVRSLHDNIDEDALILRDMLKLNQNNKLEAKSRPKRIIELPRGMVFALKWNIDVPFQSFVRWETLWQFAALIDLLYPAELVHDTKKPLMATLINPDIKEFVQNTFTDGRDDEVIDRRKGSDEDRWQETVVIERKKRAARTERQAMYTMLETILEASGWPPRACLLRTICEVAEAPFEQELLGDLLNTIFRPSKGAESSSGDEYDELLLAEHHGYHNGSCHQQYAQCPETIFNRIPYFKHELFY